MDRYERLINSLCAHMANDKTVECCGIITTDFEYIPCKNISSKPKNSFVLDPYALVKYEDRCWGIFHSHTEHHDELPSEEDKKSASMLEYKFIVGNLNKTFYLYWVDELNYLRFKLFTERDLTC